ncbi:phosphatase PAP2 family protein [Sphingobium chlorophenolicum]|uniref:Phosphoesterase PA-phosphatase related protein n=1 Tax=Sphingobium chlorophenolicum TaxID=46429 RepID=A0A081RJL7_SPHCR|nr:phosphatase PAP2 family protein [Sphingobium chlorophenolicum]KEQ55390.1 Phosphoesterase PA-phosphatase related protein precursor [Sphingobium chlorophenolicum]
MGARSISDRRKAVAKGAGALAFALFCILAIALAQRHGWLECLNIGLMGMAGRARGSSAGIPITWIMQLASMIGGTAARFALLAACVILLWSSARTRAYWLLWVTVGGTLLNIALKQVFAAPRPDLLPHLDIVHSYSFPSGHAAGNMILFGALAMLAGRRSAHAAAALAIALIGTSRVWLGVHWPSDVLAGWIEGLGWLAFCRVWLPAGRGQGEGADQAAMRRHAVGGDEAMDPETVEHGRGGD